MMAFLIGPIIMGLEKSMHVLQRGAEVNDIVNMASIAVVDAQELEKLAPAAGNVPPCARQEQVRRRFQFLPGPAATQRHQKDAHVRNRKQGCEEEQVARHPRSLTGGHRRGVLSAKMAR